MPLLDRLRRSFAVRLVTFVTFASASMPLSALASPKTPEPRPADVPEGGGDGSATGIGMPGLGSLGVPESGGQQAAGALDLASVEPATGVAHASIPFRLETARGKVQPTLSLQYSSASGQREGGIGWSLPLPSIERHNDSGHPFYQDPSPGNALDPTKEDHFTFDTQPLVPICLVGGNDVTGGKCEGALSGEQMPSWAHGWHYFRLEADTSFARFFWSPDHRTWVVQLKSGETMEFGTPLDTSDPGAVGNEVDSSIPALPTLRWRLVRRFDLMGPEVNVIYYQWGQNDPSQPLLYLNEIYDTPLPKAASGSGWGSSFGPDAFAHHVHLSWTQDDTATPAPGYMPNPMNAALVWLAVPTLLLSRVDITSASATSTTRSLVRSYSLQYYPRYFQPSYFERSLLESVQETGACPYTENSSGLLPSTLSCANGTLPPITLQYTTPQISSDNVVTTMTGQVVNALSPVQYFADGYFADVNGDGLPDYVSANIGPAPYSETLSVNLNSIGSKLNAWSPPLTMTVPDPVLSMEETITAAPPVDYSFFPQFLLATPGSTNTFFEFAFGNWSNNGVASVLWWDVDRQDYAIYTPSLSPTSSSGTWVLGTEHALPPNILLPSDLTYGPPSNETFQPDVVFGTFADIDDDGLVDWIQQNQPSNCPLATNVCTPALGFGTAAVSAFYSTQDPTGAVQPFHHATTTPPVPPVMTIFSPLQFFVDVNGDGTPDIVTLGMASSPQAGSQTVLLVKRGHGDGTFDADPGYTLAALPPNIASELYSIPTAVTVQLDDLNGDGLVDVVAADTSGITVLYTNGHGVAGSAFIPAATLPSAYNPLGSSGLPPTQITFADMNGAGVDQIVVVTGAPSGNNQVSYVNLLQGVPQALLQTISNGLGATTTISYDTVADLAIASRSTTSPWATTLPQAMHVVVQTQTTLDDPTGMLGGPYTTNYAYTDPIYDGRYRKFAGFSSVAIGRISNSGTEVVQTKFILQNTCPTMPCPKEFDEPIEAIRGLPIFTEVYSLASVGDAAAGVYLGDPGLYQSSTHHEYLLQSLYAGMDGRQTRFAYDMQTDTWLYDTNAAQKTTNASLKDVSDLSDVGAAASMSVSQTNKYVLHTKLTGDVPGSYAHLRVTRTEDSAGNMTNVVDLGHMDPGAPDSSITYTAKYGTALGLGVNAWIWQPSSVSTSGSAPQGPYSRQFNLDYDAYARVTDVYGVLSGTLALARHNASPSGGVAPKPPTQASDGTRLLTHYQYDGVGPKVGNLTEVTKNGGTQCTQLTYDPVFAQLPLSHTSFSGGCGVGGLTTMSTFDRGLEVLASQIAPDGELTTVTHDLFGRTTQVFAPDPTMPGMSEADPTTIISYAIPSCSGPSASCGPYQIVETQQRIDDGFDAAGTPAYRTSVAYVDSFGREAALVTQADAKPTRSATVRRGSCRVLFSERWADRLGTPTYRSRRASHRRTSLQQRPR
jgi:hypothetical protein